MTKLQFNEKQKPKFTILTLSVPVPNKNKSGLNSAIASSVTTTDLKISKNSILDRMYFLNLRKFILIFINTKKNCDYLEKFFSTFLKLIQIKIVYT